MDIDGPASPTSSVTPTHDEPASPDSGGNDRIASPPESPDQPASPDSETNDPIGSPAGSVTPTHDEPASPSSDTNDKIDEIGSPSSPTNIDEVVHSPSAKKSPSSPEEGAPTSPDPIENIDAPQSPEPEATIDGPQSPEPEATIDGPQSPEPEATIDGPQSPEPEARIDGPQSPELDTAQSPNQSQSRESSPKLGSGRRADDDSKSGVLPDSGDDSDVESKDVNITPPKKSKRVESSDSEPETSTGKRRLVSSDSEGEEPTPTKRKRRLDSDDSGDESDGDKAKGPQSPDESADKEAGDGDAIADIFGDSSDEEGEFEGFDEAEIKSAAATEAAIPEVSSEDELEDDREQKEGFVSDFDSMMAAKKLERASGRRKKRNVHIINDSDDLIVEMLKKMKDAADEDRMLNQNHQPATRKLTMLPVVTRQLNKAELQTAFMDCGVLGALTEWLAPLPDKSLPHLSIRQSLLKILSTLPHPHTDQLKSSGIGKAIMYLFKHPKELRANRDIAGRLINEWSRPIFGQSNNFKSMNREDLQQRDMRTLKNRRRSSEDTAKQEEEQRGLRPGDPGWIYRARVPRPSNRDYVVRPESSVDSEAAFSSKGSSKKKKTRYELQKQKMDNKKKAMKTMTAVKISIEGNKMSL